MGKGYVMKTEHRELNRKQQSIIILIALFLHAVLLTGLFLVHMKETDWFEKTFEKAMVVELEEPPMQMEQQTTQLVPQQENPWVAMNTPMPSHPELQEIPNNIPDLEKIIDKKIETAQEQQEEEISEQKLQEAIDIISQILDTNSEITVQEVVHQEEKRIDEKREPIKKPSLTKKSPTLAQLATGFMQHMAQESPMAVKSNTSGIASREQIMHLNYCHKIIECLSNSYKICRSQAPHYNQSQRACIQLAVNKNGSINKVTILQTTGSIQLDTFLVNLFKDAATSFPPVPDGLKSDPYILPLFNIDSIASFQNSQGWYIDYKGI